MIKLLTHLKKWKNRLKIKFKIKKQKLINNKNNNNKIFRIRFKMNKL